jgi:transposase-like protein
VLVELGVAEQRYRAVLEVLDEDASVTDVARRYGVARQTVHGWLRRYANDGGLGGLADKSSRPESCPHQMPPAVEARVLEIRRAHPAWGPSRIVWQLEREGREPLPGRSSDHRALVRHGLVAAKKRKRERRSSPTSSCAVLRMRLPVGAATTLSHTRAGPGHHAPVGVILAAGLAISCASVA